WRSLRLAGFAEATEVISIGRATRHGPRGGSWDRSPTRSQFRSRRRSHLRWAGEVQWPTGTQARGSARKDVRVGQTDDRRPRSPFGKPASVDPTGAGNAPVRGRLSSRFFLPRSTTGG